jgi:hypothetical protein
VAGKPFHKGSIAVPASMGTAHIGVDTIIDPRNSRFGEDGFNSFFLNN